MNVYLKKVNVLLRTGFFHIFGSSVINRGIAFLSSAILVRILTKSEYGIFSNAWNIYTLVLLANGMGAASGVLQLCCERIDDEQYTNAVYSYGTRFGICVDIVLTAIMLGIGLFVPFTIPGTNGLVCLLSGLPMIQLLYELSSVYLRANKRNQDYSKLTVTNTVLILIMTACGALMYREKGLALGYYVAYGATVVLAYVWLHVRLVNKDSAPLEGQERKSFLSISLVSMCNSALSSLLYHLDMLIIGIVVADELVLAGYKVAVLIPTGLTFIPSALVTYIYPYFAEHRRDGAWCLKRYKSIVFGLGAVNLLISAGLCLFAPLVIRILFGAQYLDIVPIFRVLAINYFLSGTLRILSGNLLVTQRKLKFNFMVAVFSGAINLAADVLFIKWWGAIGAAYATVCVVVITSILNTVYLIYTFRKVELQKPE